MADVRPAERSHRIVRVLIAVTASLSLVLGAAMVATAYTWYSARNVGVDTLWQRDFPTTKNVPYYAPGDCSSHTCNILLLGSDSRTGLSNTQQGAFGTNEDIGGSSRADTIMIVHTDPRTLQTVILSFPRDLWVDVPGHGMDKINAAFEGGVDGNGPQLMTETIQRLTGIPIDHYLYVDLNGFQHAVDTLGGVDMCIPSYYVNTPGTLEAVDPSGNTIYIQNHDVGRIVDPYTGLDVTPGCQHLSGVQALAYVRSRHNLPCSDIPDFARIGRQQQFMRALINQMLKPSELLKAPTLVQPVLQSLHRDSSFSPGDLVYLIGKMQGIGTDQVQFRSVSGTDRLIGTQDVIMMDPASKELFKAIRTDGPLPQVGSELPRVPPSEANTVVAVLDDGNAAGASQVEDILSRGGFDIGPGIVTEAAPKGVKGAAIVYRPGQEAYAGVVHGLFPGLRMIEVKKLSAAPVAVVVPKGYEPSATSSPSAGGSGSPTPPAATPCP